MFLFDKICSRLAQFLSRPRDVDIQVTTNSPEDLGDTLQKGDVLLVEGTSRISAAIKYLTQSTWSHSALFIGDTLGKADENGEPLELIEADINEGVRAIPLSRYYKMHTRICRPSGLSDKDLDVVMNYVISRLGHQYDMKNIFDLARYLFPTPPVPQRYRRRLLAFGSGDPTQAICSSLIALAFQEVKYPILPEIPDLKEIGNGKIDAACIKCRKENLHIRHHSLFAPRDFDISPFFKIVKPTLEKGFDPNSIQWQDKETYDSN